METRKVLALQGEDAADDSLKQSGGYAFDPGNFPVSLSTGVLTATIAVGGFIGVPIIYVVSASALVASATEEERIRSETDNVSAIKISTV